MASFCKAAEYNWDGNFVDLRAVTDLRMRRNGRLGAVKPIWKEHSGIRSIEILCSSSRQMDAEFTASLLDDDTRHYQSSAAFNPPFDDGQGVQQQLDLILG